MKVYLVGAGPGDPGLLTLKAQHILQVADVIVYDALANAELLKLAKPEAEIIYVGKIADQHALPQDEINKLLIAKAAKGIVARLKGGDPYIFGRGAEEALALIEANIPFEEVPGISSTVAAPAYAGIPLTHRDLVSTVTFVTGHEKPDKKNSSINWEALAKSKATLVFVMGVRNLQYICQNLITAGLAPSTPAAIIYRGTTSAQKTLRATLATLPDEAKAQNFTNPSVIVVGEVIQLDLNWFEQKPLFGQTVVVTRSREQASDLAASLSDLGAKVLEFPTIAIKPRSPQDELKFALNNLVNYDWLIFTSANAVKIFFAELAALNLDTRHLGSNKVCAIGPATAKALQAHGIVADLIPERFVAESVVEAFVAQNAQEIPNLKVLLPRASKARDILPQKLQELGCHVQVIPIYDTVPDGTKQDDLLAKIQNDQVSCLSFASSSTVENFLKLIPAEVLLAHPNIKLAAIGPITAKTLEQHGLPCHIQPEKYTIPDLVTAISKALAKNGEFKA